MKKEAVHREGLKEGEKVSIIVVKKSNALRDTFGALKFKKSTKAILRAVDKESWDE